MICTTYTDKTNQELKLRTYIYLKIRLLEDQIKIFSPKSLKCLM